MTKDAGWIYILLTDREWAGRHALKLTPAVNGIYALRSSIDNGFDSDGRLLAPLKVRITGNVAGIRELFEGCGWGGGASLSGGSQRHDSLLSPIPGSEDAEKAHRTS